MSNTITIREPLVEHLVEPGTPSSVETINKHVGGVTADGSNKAKLNKCAFLSSVSVWNGEIKTLPGSSFEVKNPTP